MSKGGQHVGTPPSPVGSISRLKQENRDLEAEVDQLKKELELYHNVDDENRDLKLRLRTAVNNGADDLLKMKEHYEAKMARLTKENRHLTLEVGRKVDERERVKDSLATMRFNTADLLKEVERLKKEAFDYRDGFMETSTELANLRELQKAAEAIEGPGDWFHKDVRPAIVALHKAIRKVRGMDGS